MRAQDIQKKLDRGVETVPTRVSLRGRREEQGANSTQKSKVSSRKNERVSMAEGSKPDVPLFQLLTDLLQQVRYASMAADLCQSTQFLHVPRFGEKFVSRPR